MLKIWSEFIFDHSYLCYSSKLWPSTQHTFIPQHFGSFGAKSDNVQNLVGIHLWSFIPPVFFNTVVIHSAYLHYAAFWFIWGKFWQCWKFARNSSLIIHTFVILQNCDHPLNIFWFFHSAAFWFIWGQIGQCWKFGRNSSMIIHTSVILQKCDNTLYINSFRSILVHLGPNRTMLKIWSEFIFDHSYLRYSSKLWPSTQHTFIPLCFHSFGAKLDNIENLLGIHLWSFIPQLFFNTVVIHSAYLHSAAFWFLWGQIGQCWEFVRNSSLIIHTSVILQNCGHPLNIPSFRSILVHLGPNRTMLKIWLEFIFDHSYLCYSSILWPSIQHTFIPQHFIHLGPNCTMLKIWSEFIFDHSYLRYSSKLWPSTQHTFILQHFRPFGGKSDNVENLVGIHLWSFIPPLFFKTVTIHSTSIHSAAF